MISKGRGSLKPAVGGGGGRREEEGRGTSRKRRFCLEWTSLPHTLLIYVFYSRFEVLFDEDSIEGSPRPNTFPFPLFRYPQKKAVNINSTQNSNPTNQNSTT